MRPITDVLSISREKLAFIVSRRVDSQTDWQAAGRCRHVVEGLGFVWSV
jgi:hypothetical protein